MVALSGCCCIPGLRGAQSSPPLPADYNGLTSPENAADLGVAEFFQDPLLTSLVAQALSGNQELRILDEEIQLASNEVLLRRGAYWPFFNLRADMGVEKPSLFTPLGAAEEQLLTPNGDHFPDPLGNFKVGADFLWQIDIWRELRNARDAAAQRYAAAIERRNFFVTQMVAEIADNYFELMALDQRLQILEQIIGLQEQSLRVAVLNKDAGRDTDLPVQRFQAEVSKNQSERLIVLQEIIQAENRINFLRGSFPQPVPRSSANILELNLPAVQMGYPAQLLQYRTDIRQAERELAAAGLDVQVARARFLPRLDITGSVGFEAFEPKYLFEPEAFFGNIAGGLVQPLINWNAIKADYYSANARQLQALYNYQRTILNAFIEVVNNLAKADNYHQSVEIKRQQLSSLETSVDVATKLFQSDRAEYADVLFSQRDLLEVETVLIETKQQELSAVVNAYQALGGGLLLSNSPQFPAELFQQEVPTDPAPSLPPAEDDGNAAPDGASSGGEKSGRAAIANQTSESEVYPLFGGRPDVDQVFTSWGDQQRSARLEGDSPRALFDPEPAPGTTLDQTLSAQPESSQSGEAEEIVDRENDDEKAPPPARAIIKAGAFTGGSLGRLSNKRTHWASESISDAPIAK
jgi:outer membrane protein, multidrug efflux system